MSQPQVTADETVVAPANGGDRQRLPSEASQPAQLARPLEESARLANMEQLAANELLGQDYNVSQENGWRKSGPPAIGSIAPATGVAAGGTAVTINGTNFTGATSASVGGVALTDLVVVDDSTITGTTGAHAAGVVDVAVTTPHGSDIATGAFEYTA